MPGIKELKTHIKSIGSTRKITRAMQMVSAAKMKKAQDLALSSRSYAEAAWALIKNISHLGAVDHPLTRVYPKAQKIGIILLTTNRGLVGSLNTNLIAKLKYLIGENAEIITEIITYGKKGSQSVSKIGQNLIADFPKLDKTIVAEEILPISQMVGQMYESGSYREIHIVFNQFISTLNQKPVIKKILPFAESIKAEMENPDDESFLNDTDFIFEPSPKTVLEHLLPRIIESQIYEAILESDASEHSARMVMMKNATEAAGDLISDLTLTFNQLRQGKITTELAEITAGRIALE